MPYPPPGGLPRCKQILYSLSHHGSPRILEWGACPFSRGSSRPRNQTRVSCSYQGSPMKELLSIMYHSAARPGIRWLSTVAACLVCAIVTADAPTVLPKVHELVYTTHGTNKMLTTFYSCLENPHGWGSLAGYSHEVTKSRN